MKKSEEAKNLSDAHKVIRAAFDAQPLWLACIPIIGIPILLRRQKLIRIGQYLVDQSKGLQGRKS